MLPNIASGKIRRKAKKAFSSPILFQIYLAQLLWFSSQTLLVWLKLSRKTRYFSNLENLSDFNFSLPLKINQQGISVILRAKNEEQKIVYCLSSIIDMFDEIVFVDNGSEDKTIELVTKFKQDNDPKSKIKILQYPFKVARCGGEHLATPENSVHSLAYYYNWTLSHCSYSFACKWDADMIIKREARKDFKSFLGNCVLTEPQKCWIVTGQTVYRDLKGDYRLSNDIRRERRFFPISYCNRFFKEEAWEVLRCAPPLESGLLPDIAFYELKFLDENELSHWTTETLEAAVDADKVIAREIMHRRTLTEGKHHEEEFPVLPKNFISFQTLTHESYTTKT